MSIPHSGAPLESWVDIKSWEFVLASTGGLRAKGTLWGKKESCVLNPHLQEKYTLLQKQGLECGNSCPNSYGTEWTF